MSKTIQAIYSAYEKKQGVNRPHLGASIIGKDCDRAIWFDFHWTTPPKFDGRMLRLFETGHMAEHRFIANLREAGVDVQDHDAKTGRQFAFSAFGGHFQGSMDGIGIGIVENPNLHHVLEFKTHSSKSFNKLLADGVQKSKPQHYAQMQIYMHFMPFGYDHAYYMAVNKDTDELYGEIVAYDMEFADRLAKRAERIIKATMPPERINDNPSWYQCKFCDHWGICHDKTLPARNCRTCTHSTPRIEGGWKCEKFGTMLTEQDQREGCVDHLFNPYILNASILDGGEDWVSYEWHDGTQWRDEK